MTGPLVAASVLLVCFLPCGALVLRGRREDAVIGVTASGVLGQLVLLLLAAAMDRSIYSEAAVALVLLSFGGSLIFLRFLERWA
ncbi:MAG TPA: monovalent cation/H+ antiporter complex subunit F [Actinomycetota bacterium]|jgi:multicomponent Na+:H+ antiporter subunit F|nr:monovalent cation/H+ antiporter complex subunit F [Actinomycetota bacterium]